MDLEHEQRYLVHRQHLIESRRLAFEQFDKAIFLLSGGGLTISLTLVQHIIPFATAIKKSFLETAWGFFTLSIILTLTSFITSQKALDNEIEKLDDVYVHKDVSADSRTNHASIWTRRLNLISLTCFFIAIAALIGFVFVNFSKAII